MNVNLEKLNELDVSNIGDWPIVVKAVVVVFACALVVGAWYYFDTQVQLAQLETVEREEITLKKDFEKKQAKAANLDAYREQLEEMRQSFGAMLRQLPDKTEVASLLVDVSQTGLAAGLEFELFRPQPENKKEFYAELPINIRVLGEYHQFGQFVSGLAALPRIVTVHDVTIEPQKDGKKLVMAAIAKTYRYLEEEKGK